MSASDSKTVSVVLNDTRTKVAQKRQHTINVDTTKVGWHYPVSMEFFVFDRDGGGFRAKKRRFFIFGRRNHRPFVVYVTPTSARVYQKVTIHSDEEDDQRFMKYELIHTFTELTKVWIPHDGADSRSRGNNLLLQTSHSNEYILISASIFKFVTKAPIIKFNTRVNEWAEPCPHAVDQDGRAYLLWDTVVLESIPEHGRDDPVSYWLKATYVVQALRVGEGVTSSLEMLVLNADAAADGPNWHLMQRLNGPDYDYARRNQLNLALREFAMTAPAPGPDEEYMTLYEPEKFSCNPTNRITFKNYYAICDLFPTNYDLYPPEPVFIKIAVTSEWEPLDCEKYQALQAEWRARLKCSVMDTIDIPADSKQ